MKQRSIDKNLGGQVRSCIATGIAMSPISMIRFVIGPEGDVVPDIYGKLPGRGIWVSAKSAALEKAVKKKLFYRSAKKPILIRENLVSNVENILARRLINLISLARKAGQAVTGFEKVKGLLETDRAKVLIQANDGSKREKAKFRPPGNDSTKIGCMTSRELGLAFGRESVIHAAITAGGLYKEISMESLRLAGIRENNGNTGAKKGNEDV